jgi:hypothetical protein
MVAVQLPSGATYPVFEEEVDYFQERVELYMTQNHFPNISDKQDVDRMMMLELFVYRWGTWLSQQRDWWNEPIDANEIQKALNATSTELRQLKKLLGIDKLARDRQKGEDSVGAFIANILFRAKEFGVMRETQLAKALELFQQMSALLTLHLNTDEVEQREMRVTTEDLIEWLRDICVPEFEEIDAYFRKNRQSTWIRQQ